MARNWYAYNGIGDPLLVSSYNLALSKPTCINGNILCAIYAFGFGPTPTYISVNMRFYIQNAQLTLITQPDLPPNSKKYVYLKYQ